MPVSKYWSIFVWEETLKRLNKKLNLAIILLRTDLHAILTFPQDSSQNKMMDKNTLIWFFGRHMIITLRNKTNTSVWRKVLLNVYNFSDSSLKRLDPITIAWGIDIGFDKTWTLFLSAWNGLCYQILSFYYIYVHCMTDCHEDIWKI